MTDKEKAIVMAYTGYTMLTGEKFDLYHQYIEALLQRPVYTHELAEKEVQEEIHEKSRGDFRRLSWSSDSGEEAFRIWLLRTGNNANC